MGPIIWCQCKHAQHSRRLFPARPFSQRVSKVYIRMRAGVSLLFLIALNELFLDLSVDPGRDVTIRDLVIYV